MGLQTSYVWVLAVVSVLTLPVYAEWGHRDGGHGHRPPYWDDNSNNGNNTSSAAFAASLSFTTSSAGKGALIAHAVIASAVWVLLVPSAGILLRLDIRSPWVMRVHATMQIISYLLYIVAVGLGIYLVQNMSPDNFESLWDDSHPQLGLAVLGLAFFQPILGALHKRLQKKRLENAKSGKGGPLPGRTLPARMHLWLGRGILILAIINGGLGIDLADKTYFQSDRSISTAAIIYSTVSGTMALIYVLIVVRFEVRKAKRDRESQTAGSDSIDMNDEVPPTYTESQESLRKDRGEATRYE